MKLIIAPRTHREISADPIQLKSPPNRKPFEKQSLLLTILPSLSMSLPMLLGIFLMSRSINSASSGSSYMTMGLTTAIGSAIIGTFLAVTNFHRRNEKARFDERLRKRSYREYLKYLSDTFKEHTNYAENILRNDYPSFSELIDCRDSDFSGSVTCLNRLCTDTSDLIFIRLGMGDRPYVLPIKYDNDFPLIADTLRNEMSDIISLNSRLRRVPVCVSLKRGSSLSVVADNVSDYYSVFTMLVTRICLSYSPEAVKVGFELSDPLYKKAVAGLKFMPHLIETTESGRDRDDEGFLIIFTDCWEPLAEYNENGGKIRAIRVLMGIEGGDVLLHVSGGTAFLVDENGRNELNLDSISQSEFEIVMRTCCRLRDFEPEGNNEAIPKQVPILNMLQDCNDVRGNWQSDAAVYDITIPIGLGALHQPVFLNLHERGDGPHGLIAGMTGSGKSELLVSMILTMAVKYPPWYVAFFLIDYKGGGMARGMEQLPHVIGSISNLSGGDIGRAFLSIRSENERRERLFGECGVNNILRYQEKYRDGIVSEPLPHIFIIVDEFAQLKMEEPDFMQDLIAMSRVGRSLGIHLILCTQKPSGSVDGQIISNSGFQIALKLQDPMDSKEVIKRPDAAYLNNPGRGILRCGNDERVETFQAAYSLSPVILPKKKKAVAADYFGRPAEAVYEPAALGAEAESTASCPGSAETSLDYLLREIADASLECKIIPRPLWLPELPSELSLERVYEIAGEDALFCSASEPGMSVTAGLWDNLVAVGLWDDPVTVSQGVLSLNLDEGNILICGAPYSGKSTFLASFLSTFLCSVRVRLEKQSGMQSERFPEVYIFDWGGGKLSVFEEFFTEIKGRKSRYFAEGDEEKVQEMIRALLEGFGEPEGCGALGRCDASARVVIIDGIGSLIEQAGYAISGLIRDLLRKSDLLNVRLIVTAYGINGKEVNKSMQGYFRQFIALRQQDMYQYSEVLSEPGFKGRTNLCPGRGYTRHGGRIVEFQTAFKQ